MNNASKLRRTPLRRVAVALLAVLCALLTTTLASAARPVVTRYLALEFRVADGPIQLVAVPPGGLIRYIDAKRNFSFVLVNRDEGQVTDSSDIRVELRELLDGIDNSEIGNLLDATSATIGDRFSLRMNSSARVHVQLVRFGASVAEALQVEPEVCQTRGSLILYKGDCRVGCPSSVSLEAAGVRAECGVCCSHLRSST